MTIYQDTSAHSQGYMPRKRQCHTTVAGMGQGCRRGGDLCGAEVLLRLRQVPEFGRFSARASSNVLSVNERHLNGVFCF